MHWFKNKTFSPSVTFLIMCSLFYLKTLLIGKRIPHILLAKQEQSSFKESVIYQHVLVSAQMHVFSNLLTVLGRKLMY